MRLRLLVALVIGACGFGDDFRGGVIDNCGDGVVDPDEGCDDGNRNDGDGCSAQCEVETANPVCGNGIREAGEGCDDDNTTNGDGCSSTCQVETPNPVCGNNVLETGEQCDDNNTMNGDGCSSTCQIEAPVDCELVPQSGCPSGQACDLDDDDDGSTECRAITTAGNEDDACTVTTACAAGYSCVSDFSLASCYEFCTSDAQCSGVGSRCFIELADDMGDPIPGVTMCSNSCDPLAQTGCPAGMGCIVGNMAGGDVTDCREMGTDPDGSPCNSTLECLSGSLCVTRADMTRRCQEMCNVNGPDTCAGASTCGGFSNPVTFGAVEIGTCSTP
jgi:cysteine-rich repeat protein